MYFSFDVNNILFFFLFQLFVFWENKISFKQKLSPASIRYYQTGTCKFGVPNLFLVAIRICIQCMETINDCLALDLLAHLTGAVEYTNCTSEEG